LKSLKSTIGDIDMTPKEHDTTVIHSGNESSGGAAWFVVGIALVIALIAGYFMIDGNGGSNSVSVDVNSPAAEAPAPTDSAPAAAPAPAADPAPSGSDSGTTTNSN